MANPFYLGLALLLFGAALVGFIVMTIQDRRRKVISGRIDSVMMTHIVEVEEVKPDREGMNQRLTRVMRNLPSNYGERIEAAIATTGNTITPARLLIAGIVAFFGTFYLMYMFNFGWFIGLGIAIAAAYFVPMFLFKRARNKYRRQFLEVFPDALDLITRVVRAGVPVSTGIEVAGNESPEPVKSVFAEIASQNRVGISFEDSLNRMVKRLNIPDFSFFASALVLQRESGGNIAETVQNLSGVVRKRKELRKKGEALTAESRTVAAILGALPFAVGIMVAIVNFDYIQVLFTDSRGNMILGVALMMLTLGMWVMRTMVNNALR
jgi:tight adherence protein B